MKKTDILFFIGLVLFAFLVFTVVTVIGNTSNWSPRDECYYRASKINISDSKGFKDWVEARSICQKYSTQ